MPSWHQINAWKLNGFPKLSHPTQWSSYNPTGHLCVMRHASHDECVEYCKRTGDIPVAPDNLNPTRTMGPKD
jgi:hypothetical protein